MLVNILKAFSTVFDLTKLLYNLRTVFYVLDDKFCIWGKILYIFHKFWFDTLYMLP
jgi:hypothetical protein